MTDLIEAIQSATGPSKPFKAFAVLEEFESTGGIVFAKSAVAARRMGANEYADGDFSAVSCRRAKWADDFYGKPLPAGEMIAAGWHFECCNCGVTIDEDYLHETDRLYEDVVGSQHSLVYCDAVCEARHKLHRAECSRTEARWLRRFAKIAEARFPGAIIRHEHAYARSRFHIAQVAVSFDFPGQRYAPARLEWREKSSWDKAFPKPRFTCAVGDKEAFEAYASALKARGEQS